MKIADIKALVTAKKFDEALRAIDATLEAFSDNPHLWNLRGDVIQLSDNSLHPTLEEAEKSYLNALEISPNDPETLESLAHFYDAVMPDRIRAKSYAIKFVQTTGRSLEQMRLIIDGKY